MFCGLLTVVYSILILTFMPDSPMEAKFLSERNKVIAVERLRANQMGIISRQWRWDHVWETLYDLKTWVWFFLIVSISYVEFPFIDRRHSHDLKDLECNFDSLLKIFIHTQDSERRH
jgi:hypothetical protein